MINSNEKIEINGVWVEPDTWLQNFEKNLSDEALLPVYEFLKNWWNTEEFMLFNTSGSTGEPKLIRISKNAMRRSATITNEYFGLGIKSCALVCLPVQFIAGAMMIVRAIEGGYPLVVVRPSSNPFKHPFLKQVTFCACTPMQVAEAVTATDSKERFESISTVIVGGGEISNELEQKIQFLRNKVFATYGMTETITHVAVRAVNGNTRSTSFDVLPGFNVALDERNCLIIEAPHLGDRIFTNDVVKLTSRKFEWIGRADNIINSGGIKFSPEELEKEIAGLIPQRYVISSVPDAVLGNRLVLVLEVEQLSNQEKETCIAKVSEILKGPRKIHELRILGDFPVTGTGKIKRKEILINLAKNQNT
ncbi:MAG: AMP-binding protein [Flavobacteriales bacterium]